MPPKITIGLIIVIMVAYLAGARWPQLATRFGLA